MNFDQKAVKFLANFYINGGKHWTHGPLRQKLLVPTRPKAAVRLSGPEPGAACEQMRPQEAQEFPASIRMHTHPLQEPPPPCTRNLRELQGGGRRAWRTVWSQRESPVSQKADFKREPERPSPADHRPLSLGAGRPASRTRGARARLGQLRVGGAVHQVQPHLQALPQTPGAEKRPSPNTYDILPGCCLQRSRPPAFSLSRSPAFDSWVSYSLTPGPATYHVEDCYNSRFPSAPGVVIQGVRRPKRHDTGPFSML
ncbi:protein STPG3 isoform X3 [Manis javanica]|uniref:protein STPG3 isoform X3 n=1 Tax=Manis javanica TaxID=9974 RepID=UPI003C6D0127